MVSHIISISCWVEDQGSVVNFQLRNGKSRTYRDIKIFDIRSRVTPGGTRPQNSWPECQHGTVEDMNQAPQAL